VTGDLLFCLDYYQLYVFLYSFKNELINDKYFIENLSNDSNFDLPLYNESLMIFVENKDTVYIKSLRQLFIIKEKKYKEYKNIDDFLFNVLNKNLLVKSDLDNIYTVSFKINKSLINEFKEKGLNYFKEEYCEISSIGNNKFYLKSNLNLNNKLNVMYIFFKNNYYVVSDDYSGKYVLIDKNSNSLQQGFYSAKCSFMLSKLIINLSNFLGAV